MKPQRKKALLWTGAALALLLVAFWRLGFQPLHDWDEARHGQNALEMLRNGDFVNYFYRGSHDTWNAKPPLLIWSIVVSYMVFGLNEFALRFPSAVAGIITVIATTTLARMLSGPRAMWITFALLLTSKGVFGFHTGRTGDMDALLMAMGMSAVALWQAYLTHTKTRFALLAGVCWGLAFYAKGMAALMFVPGAFILTLTAQPRPKLSTLSAATALALCFPVSWFLIIKRFGLVSESQLLAGQSGSSIDVMIFYDVWQRLTGNIEGHGKTAGYGFVFTQWDVYFSPWIYVLYIALISMAIGQWTRTRTSLPLPAEQLSQHMQLKNLSRWVLVYVAPMALVLTFARSKLPWYIAPTIPFLCLWLAAWTDSVLLSKRWGQAVALLLLMIASLKHFKDYIMLRHDAQLERISAAAPQIQKSPCVRVLHQPVRQAEVLKLHWLNPNIKILESQDPGECALVLPAD